jgi:haloalkane dehalogenase
MTVTSVTTTDLQPSQPTWLDRQLWPYAPQYLQLPEGRQHYVAIGPDRGEPPVVLIHGTPTWSLDWRHVLSGLLDHCRLIALDHLGFGLSDRPADADYTPHGHARRTAAALEALVPTGKLHLVVHDFGGPFALGWALANPHRLASLTILNSWMWSLRDDPKMYRMAKLAQSWWFRWLYRYANASQRLIMPSAYGDRRKLTPQLHAQYLRCFDDRDAREQVLYALAYGLLGADDLYAGLWDRHSALQDVPVQLVWGLRDSAFGPQCLERWRQALPHASVTVLAGAGHWPQEEEPEAVVRVLGGVL